MTYPAGNARTLAEVLRWRAEHQPEAVAYTFLRDGEGQEENLTYRELDRWARAIGAELQNRCRRGDRALLVFPPGLDFLAAFVGCWYADVVAVPTLPPRPHRPDSPMRAIAADAGVGLILTTAGLSERLTALHGDGPRLDPKAPELAVDRIDLGLAAAWRDPDVPAESLAFLQYTSGSTGSPKGVMVGHRNLMHNQEMIRLGFGHEGEVRILSWLPSYHDMGLIGMLLQPLYLGCPCVFFSPQAFLQKPSRWLEGISRYRSTSSGGPNFAYDLCLQTVTEEQRRELDLSSWRVAFNGAEPVRAETLERFAAAFAPCGFHREALLPCYGLAEATLFVTGHLDHGRPAPRVAARDGAGFVGCGRGWLDQDLRIVDPETGVEQPAGSVGEIWLASPSVALGYWERPQETAETFAAALPGMEEKRFLRTGDLGFVQAGELFVTGRLKDLVIIRGRNHYPQDIEKTVERAHPAMRPNSGAAFSIEHAGEERLVVVHEVERTALRSLDVQAVVAAVRQAVREEHEVQVHALVLLKPGGVPRTSSGKIQRRACREGFLTGELPVVGRWEREPKPPAEDRPSEPASGPETVSGPPPAQVESWLIDRLAGRLGLAPDQLEVGRPLAEYDLDSLAAVRLSGELGEWLGRELSPTLVYDYPTIRALAQYLTGPRPVPGRTTAGPARGEPVAVIGMGCRFPGADDPAAFWRLLREGGDAIREVPSSRWQVTEAVSRWGGFLDQVDGFDPAFF
ncbi:MAG: AMP-binding protein, partial [Candidatus Latescibacterota bacterium]